MAKKITNAIVAQRAIRAALSDQRKTTAQASA
jgi:hypothetical protein